MPATNARQLVAWICEGNAMSWKVERWGGQERYPRRVVFTGSEDLAPAKYEKLHAEMRQGDVVLLDDEGKTIKWDWAPRLCTRW